MQASDVAGLFAFVAAMFEQRRGRGMVGFRKVDKACGSGDAGGRAATDTGAGPDRGGATIVSGSMNRGIQARASRSDGWNKVRRAQFLEVLERTCNVRAAAASVGLHFSGAYALRLRDAAFAASWATALAGGYDRLEEALLAAAIAGLSDDRAVEADDVTGEGDLAGQDSAGQDLAGIEGMAVPDTGIVRLASMQAVHVGLAMLGRYRTAQAAGGMGQKRRHRRATVEETNASIAKKLDALAKRLAAPVAVMMPVAVMVPGGPSDDDGSSSTESLLGRGMLFEKEARHDR